MLREEKVAHTSSAALQSVRPLVGRVWQNWSRSCSFQVEHLLTPSTEADLIECVLHARQARCSIKVLGAGHSLSHIALPDSGHGWPMSLHNYSRILSVDHSRRLVTAQAGCTLKALSSHLHSVGLAIQLLGSISEQTLGGVLQTATHGTGARYGPFHTQVHSLVVITGKAERLRLAADDLQQVDLFNAAVVGLGVMGIVSEVTLRVVPLFELREVTYGLSWNDMLAQLPQLVRSNDRLKLLWFPYTNHVGVWTANPVDDHQPSGNASNTSHRNPSSSEEPLWPIRSPTPEANDPFMHADPDSPVSTAPYALCSPRATPSTTPTAVDVAAIRADNEMRFNSAYSQRITRIDIAQRILNCDCGPPGSLLASEGCVPFRSAVPFLVHWRHVIHSRQLPARGNIEIRFVRGDSAWMSITHVPHRQPDVGDSIECDESLFVSVAVNWSLLATDQAHEASEGQRYLDIFGEECVERFEGRLHWGKMGKLKGENIRRWYDRWEAFRRLRQQHDPDGVFLNAFAREALLLP